MAERRRLAPHLHVLRRLSLTQEERCNPRGGLAQEALVKAWRARESYTPGTNLKAWVFMILRNHFYSERRKAWRKNEVTTENDIERPGPRTAAQDASIALAEVREALNHLSPDQREAIILVGAGGFSYEEAAEICAVAVGTIKSRVSRARKALLEILENNDASFSSADGLRAADAFDDIMRQADELSRDIPADA